MDDRPSGKNREESSSRKEDTHRQIIRQRGYKIPGAKITHKPRKIVNIFRGLEACLANA